jgi:hypothetical protein
MSKTLVYEYKFDITTRKGCYDAADAIKAIADRMIDTTVGAIWQVGKPTFNISMSSDGNTLIIRTDKEIK